MKNANFNQLDINILKKYTIQSLEEMLNEYLKSKKQFELLYCNLIENEEYEKVTQTKANLSKLDDNISLIEKAIDYVISNKISFNTLVKFEIHILYLFTDEELLETEKHLTNLIKIIPKIIQDYIELEKYEKCNELKEHIENAKNNLQLIHEEYKFRLEENEKDKDERLKAISNLNKID